MGRLTDEMVRLCGEITSARNERLRLLRGVKQGATALRDQVTSMSNDLRRARGEMAARSRERRTAFASQLRTEVGDLRREVSSDLAAARRVFFPPPGRLVPERALEVGRASRGPTVSKTERAPASEAAISEQGLARPEATLPERAADDLQAISGIGPAMQRHLHAAGISSFSQLARTTPDELRGVLGNRARLANVEEWVAQARRLAGLQGREG